MPLENFRQVYLPYCLKKLPSGNWVVLNREYKPVSHQRRCAPLYNYEDYGVPLKMSSALRKKLACLEATKDSPDNNIFLYSDNSIPKKENPAALKKYLEKLALLMELKVI